MNKIDILGVKIDSLTQVQVLERIRSFFWPQAGPSQPAWPEPLADSSTSYKLQATSCRIITANPEIVLEAWGNENYRQLVNSASLVVADGIGLLWAAKFLSLKSDSLFNSLMQMVVTGASLVFYPDYAKEVLPERITGVDLMEKISEKASQKNSPRLSSGEAGWKVYLLGAEAGVAEKTAEVLKNKYLNLQIVGAEQGIVAYEPGTMNYDLINRVNSSGADILFVAFGAPKQDFFIHEYLPELSNVKLAMGVGGAFDFISGKTRRAPQIYRDLGLEWLYRFIHEPWRAVRIFNATIRFIINVVKYKHLIKHS